VITSADGTTIGYRSTGSGPGLIVIHGALETAKGYQGFAAALAEDFTVHVVDRRGRGESGPHDPAHSLKTEVDDIRAVQAATGAQRLFGVSSGAVIALEAALQLENITHVVAYEPPINAPGRKDHVFRRFEQEVADGQTFEAMATILNGLEVGPRWLRLLPRKVLAGLMRKLADGDEEDLVALVPTVRYDFRIVRQGSANLERLKALDSRVLLLGGTKSARYLKEALQQLQTLLPQATSAQLGGANHNSSTESPQLVVSTVRSFLNG
jgi:pimeloyl-ACP methyl ester carboxylesterase